MKIFKITIILVIGLVFVSNQMCQTKEDVQNLKNNSYNGFVPNQETAIKIAEAIWLPIYGKEIYSKKPFKVTLQNDSIWIVEGTLNRGKGGVPYIEIQKKDCKILKVIHSL
jgi:hypothetical protein